MEVNIKMIVLRDMTDEHIQEIKGWPQYGDDCKELDYALRDGGWLDSDCLKAFSAFRDNILIGFSILWKNEDNATIGIALQRDAIGYGIGTEIINLMLQNCFFLYGFDRVYVDVRKSNLRSKRMCDKVGFKLINEHYMNINGQQVYFNKLVIEKESFEVKCGYVVSHDSEILQ